jgi:hypothetical protein
MQQELRSSLVTQIFHKPRSGGAGRRDLQIRAGRGEIPGMMRVCQCAAESSRVADPAAALQKERVLISDGPNSIHMMPLVKPDVESISDPCMPQSGHCVSSYGTCLTSQPQARLQWRSAL